MFKPHWLNAGKWKINQQDSALVVMIQTPSLRSSLTSAGGLLSHEPVSWELGAAAPCSHFTAPGASSCGASVYGPTQAHRRGQNWGWDCPEHQEEHPQLQSCFADLSWDMVHPPPPLDMCGAGMCSQQRDLWVGCFIHSLRSLRNWDPMSPEISSSSFLPYTLFP